METQHTRHSLKFTKEMQVSQLAVVFGNSVLLCYICWLCNVQFVSSGNVPADENASLKPACHKRRYFTLFKRFILHLYMTQGLSSFTRIQARHKCNLLVDFFYV